MSDVEYTCKWGGDGRLVKTRGCTANKWGSFTLYYSLVNALVLIQHFNSITLSQLRTKLFHSNSGIFLLYCSVTIWTIFIGSIFSCIIAGTYSYLQVSPYSTILIVNI